MDKKEVIKECETFPESWWKNNINKMQFSQDEMKTVLVKQAMRISELERENGRAAITRDAKLQRDAALARIDELERELSTDHDYIMSLTKERDELRMLARELVETLEFTQSDESELIQLARNILGPDSTKETP